MKFVKGGWVEICHYPDYKWEHWTVDHTNMCGKTGQITDEEINPWTGDEHIEVEHRGKRHWFLPDHLIRVENYNIVFSEAVHDACEKLQQHEKICKRLRDEILEEVFGDEKAQEIEEEERDDLYDDWQEVTTKEVIPLPGNGGTMTDPSDSPKSKANSYRKKVRTKRGKAASRVKSKKKPISDDWTITEEELEDLQDYVDNLPYQNTTNDDYEYFYGDDDDSDWFT